MPNAVIYARVSSREQEREGYSIPAQRKLLNEYARVQGFRVQQEFIDVESAKNPGRKEFGAMLRLLQSDPLCRAVLVEKTDRLYRNRTDSIAFEEMIEKRNVEIHLVKEGRVIAKDSRSQDKFMHDIHVAVAKHYSENLHKEVKKGMREKAEQGIYPGHAPFGYQNNTATRTIEADPQRVPVLRRIFELYASGQHSLTTLRQAILRETGVRLSRAYLEISRIPSTLAVSTGKASSTKARTSRSSRQNCSSACRTRLPDVTSRNIASTTLPLLAC